MLIKAGAEVDVAKQLTENLRGWTPLHDACQQGHSMLASLLLKHGANPNGTGNVSTPLELAVSKGHLDTVRALLQFKADTDLHKGEFNLLTSALPSPAILRNLLEAGANPDMRNAGNSTPLMEAAARPLPEATRILLQFKADPNARGEGGLTPLHFVLSRPGSAKQDAALEIVKILVAAGADVNALTTAGTTPLRFAMEWNTDPFRTVLKGAGAQLYAPNFQAIGLTRTNLEQPLITFRKDSTGWNRYTALEAMYYYYTGSVEGSGSVAQAYPVPTRTLRFPGNAPGTPQPISLPPPRGIITASFPLAQGGQFPFPDISGVQIRRPRSDKPGDEELIPLNLSTNIDCTKDLVLRFGDLVEIPERVHSLAEQPMGLDRVQESALKECLQRKVRVTTMNAEKTGKEVEVILMPSYLSQLMRMDEVRRVLSSSSDLSRVRVKSTDPVTKQPRETLIDVQVVTNGRQPLHEDIWLHDGDVVEVPER
jgi:ankyrin repeat protein